MSERTTRMRSASSNSASRCSRSSSVGSCASGAPGAAALSAPDSPSPPPSAFASAALCAARHMCQGMSMHGASATPPDLSLLPLALVLCWSSASDAGASVAPTWLVLSMQCSTPCVCICGASCCQIDTNQSDQEYLQLSISFPSSSSKSPSSTLPPALVDAEDANLSHPRLHLWRSLTDHPSEYR